MPDEELPSLVTRFKADLTDLETGIASGEVMIRQFRNEAARGLSGTGGIGQSLAREMGDAAAQSETFWSDAFTRVEHDAVDTGRAAGRAFTQGMDEEIIHAGDLTQRTLDSALGPNSGVRAGLGRMGRDTANELMRQIEAGELELGPPDFMLPDGTWASQLKKNAAKSGAQAGAALAGGMSPLVISGLATAATIGPGLILGPIAAALLGIGALVTKGNADLRGSYRQLGQDAKAAVDQATEPLIPALQASLNVLDQGVGKIGPELKGTFASIAPDATSITGGLVSLVSNTLPGLETGLKDVAPYAHTIAQDFGGLGNGLGGFFAGLGQGMGGATTGFTALMTTVEHLLPDVGRIVGDLSNGLGPALHDIEIVAVPAANALADVADALPPGVIRGAADAIGVLYGAFKIGTLTSAIEKGTTFTQWLGLAKTESKAAATEITAVGAAEETTAAKTGLMATAGAAGTKAFAGLGTAADLATGPLGLILAGTGLLGDELGKLAGVGEHLTVDLGEFTSELQAAAGGSYFAQQQVNALAGSIDFMQATTGHGAGALGQMDDALVKLQETNPAQAAADYQALADAFSKDGKSAADVAGMLPQYTQAVKDASLASGQLGTGLTQQQAVLAKLQTALAAPANSFDTLSGALTGATLKAQQNAQQSATSTLAALGFADGESTLATQLNITLQAFTNDSTAAGGYKTALDALYGKYQSYSDAQATFTTDLDKASKGLKSSKDGFDTSTTAGAANYTLMSQLATANENRAEALLTETGNQQQANTELQNGALAIDAMAKKAGFTKGQIDALNIALYGTKNIGDISVPISADTSGVYAAVDKVINWIDAQSAYVQVHASSGGLPGGRAYLDGGGWVTAPQGAPQDAVVHGGEYMLSADMLAGTQPVDQRVLAALRAGMPGAGSAPGAPSYAPAGGGEPSITVIAPVYLDGQLVGRGVTRGARAETQNFVRRNGQTGFTGVMR